MLRKTRYTLLIYLCVLSLMGVFIAIYIKGDSLPKGVNSAQITSLNGVVLNVLKSNPRQISLYAIDENVTRSGKNGINGGFFWEEQLLSIAVNDDHPVNGNPREFGSGWYNVKYKRGTMVYDKETNTLSVQKAASVEDLQFSDRKQYWAQGGVSMNLQDDIGWRSIAFEEEALPFPDGMRLRSAMVFDSKMDLYLIVSSTKCTAEQFRSAIINEVGAGKLIDGIYLDGDGSSQLLAENTMLIGDDRTVLQMIAVQTE